MPTSWAVQSFSLLVKQLRDALFGKWLEVSTLPSKIWYRGHGGMKCWPWWQDFKSGVTCLEFKGHRLHTHTHSEARTFVCKRLFLPKDWWVFHCSRGNGGFQEMIHRFICWNTRQHEWQGNSSKEWHLDECDPPENLKWSTWTSSKGFSSYLLGDKGYPVLTWLIVLYKDNHSLSILEILYNKYMRHGQSVIECAFGVMKCVW